MYNPMARNPSNITLSLQGMYDYDNTIFSGMILPEGVERQTVIDTILMFAGANEVRYPSVPLLTHAITTFFKHNEFRYSEFWKSMNFDYDPLLTYDIQIAEQRDISGSDTTNRTVESTAGGESSNTHSVSAFNASGFSPESQDNGHSTSSSDGTEQTDFGTNRHETYSRRESGDNSARSTMDNIRQYRDVSDYDFYRIIAMDFEDEITIPCYTRESHNIDTGGWRL